jgi:hypothetical protein
MRVTCPSCQAEHALEALLTREAEARAVASVLERGVPFGALLLRYIALFRPGKRRLGLERMASLIEELLPDLQRGAITRKGREWAASPEVWRASFEAVLAARDKGSLTLPLTSHGYLFEIVCAQVDKAEAASEREREAERRNRGGPAPSAPQAPMGVMSVISTGHVPRPYGPGPSRAALKLQQQIAEARQARATPSATADTPDPEPKEPKA